jgi:hypothetical protein
MMEHMDTHAQDRSLRSDWYERRGIVVADDLNQLRGPTSSRVSLPVHLDGSAHSVYDLDEPYSRELLYRTVLMEAGSEKDLETWLDRDILTASWPEMYLSPSIRTTWESHHPVLARPHGSPDLAGS